MAEAGDPPPFASVPVVTPGGATQESPLQLPANHALVVGTPFLPWDAVAASGAAQVSLPLYVALKAFIPKARISTAPADEAAARVSVFRARFTAAFWSTLLGEYVHSGLVNQPITTPQDWDTRLRELVVQNPANLLIKAAAWNLAPDLVVPGAGAAAASHRRVIAPIRFIHLATVLMLQNGSPLPLSRFADLAGYLGPCSTVDSRKEETGLVQASGLLLRSACGGDVLHDGGRARALPVTLDRVKLPGPLRASVWSKDVHGLELADVLGLELADGITFRSSHMDRDYVVERRIHCLGAM